MCIHYFKTSEHYIFFLLLLIRHWWFYWEISPLRDLGFYSSTSKVQELYSAFAENIRSNWNYVNMQGLHQGPNPINRNLYKLYYFFPNSHWYSLTEYITFISLLTTVFCHENTQNLNSSCRFFLNKRIIKCWKSEIGNFLHVRKQVCTMITIGIP